MGSTNPSRLAFAALLLFPSFVSAEPELIRAFHFGSRDLDCQVFNEPTQNYESVVQSSPAALAYDAGRGWGYEITVPGDTSRGGYGQFGPFDDSPNNRDVFGDSCPEELYDSFIGSKDFVNPCTVPIDVFDPDEPGAICQIPEGAIFRVDVPNGKYRFVAAVGSADNPHKSRVLAQDGGLGGPELLDTLNDNFVTLVNNFDQAKHGTGVFARVGFGCYIPPPAAVNGFINCDEEGLLLVDEFGTPTGDAAECPILDVTSGYVRIHALKGFGTGDANGGNMVILELWRVDGNEDFGEPLFTDVTRDFQTLDPRGRGPGEEFSVLLTASNVAVPTTIVETIPAGWTVTDAGDGTVTGNGVTFDVVFDGPLVYDVASPAGCDYGTFSAEISPEGGCTTTFVSTVACVPPACGLYASGGISGALILGPVDLGADPGAACDDNGLMPTTDYLANEDTGDESTVLVDEGDTVYPDFGGLAGGIGVGFAPNLVINPDQGGGGLTAWRADADDLGYINFELAQNVGALDWYLVYTLVYLENTTGGCRDVILELGSDDAIKARLNGRLIHVNQVCRGVPGYDGGDKVPATLAPGTNILLVATVESGGGSGVRVVVRDTDGTPLTSGDVTATCEAPADYPASSAPPQVTRSFSSGVANAGGELTVTLSVAGASGPATITDSFDPVFSVADDGGGTVAGNSISFDTTVDGDLAYTLTAPEPCPDADFAPFDGTVTIERGCPTEAPILGANAVRCITACPVPPDADPAELVWAFRFATSTTPNLFIETPNEPGTEYILISHVAGDPLSLVYDEDLDSEYGYERLYSTGFDGFEFDLPLAPHTVRGGFEIFGPFDDSPNGRNQFTDFEPEEIYDSFIGAKNWLAGQTSCTELINDPPDPNVPCAEGNIAPLDPDGIIFRVDVPNGFYRFVAALGDVDNPHAHRLVAEDGGEGPPTELGPNHVVLVSNFDQAQHPFGETDAARPGEGVFARVGFDGKTTPSGDGLAPDPQFVNIDADGLPTESCPESPVLEVTQGYIRFHQLQANSNPLVDPPSPNDPNGGDFVLLEIWSVGEPPPCEGRDSDTHCGTLAVNPDGGPAGTFTATVSGATDDAGDRINYTFTADDGAGTTMTVGPRSSNSASFDLTDGTWTITAVVDDDCPGAARDNTCSTSIRVGTPPAGVPFLRGDADTDGKITITDGIFVLNWLFRGGRDPECLPSADATGREGDAVKIELTDAVRIFGWLFLSAADNPIAPPNVCGEVLADPVDCMDVDPLMCP